MQPIPSHFQGNQRFCNNISWSSFRCFLKINPRCFMAGGLSIISVQFCKKNIQKVRICKCHFIIHCGVYYYVSVLQTNASRKSKISSSLKILTFTNICFSPLEMIIFFSCYLLTSYRYGKNIHGLIFSCLHCYGLGVTPRSQSIYIRVKLINTSRTEPRVILRDSHVSANCN